MKNTSFEDYLKDIHAKNYTGLDDDMPDDFDNWLADLDVAQMLEYGEELFANLLDN